MNELTTPIKPAHVRVGMRIAINSRFSKNLSLASMRDRCVPMAIEVGQVSNIATSVVIESRGHYMFEVPCNCWLGKLNSDPSDLDTLKPQPKFSPTTFRGISID